MSDDMKAMMNEIAADMPLRSFTSAGIPFDVVEGLVAILNGHYAAGIAKVVRRVFKFGRRGLSAFPNEAAKRRRMRRRDASPSRLSRRSRCDACVGRAGVFSVLITNICSINDDM